MSNVQLPLTNVVFSTKNINQQSPLNNPNKGLGLELNVRKPNRTRKHKDSFMKDLLGFRLNNPTAFSHKAFGTERLGLPRSSIEKAQAGMSNSPMSDTIQGKVKLPSGSTPSRAEGKWGMKTTSRIDEQSDISDR